ncbi:hypothetical protein TNIN_13671 [Trichonephila inaurata madagascariensis]|uniref:Uncharacterized protein n=1 Tax=Trichonephila inaurata madagascariensis TaxID=2747483 RepID=A0A8X6MJH6_9ARAC|nr:hypothetical protein TNIN_13671 [Trichonephila inaurata madagascariensis]
METIYINIPLFTLRVNIRWSQYTFDIIDYDARINLRRSFGGIKRRTDIPRRRMSALQGPLEAREVCSHQDQASMVVLDNSYTELSQKVTNTDRSMRAGVIMLQRF